MSKMNQSVAAITISIALLTGCAAGSVTSSHAAASADKAVATEKATPKVVTATPSVGTDTQIIGPFFSRTDQHPDKELIQRIDEEKTSLDIAIYSLTHPGIVKAIIDAEKRGVKVRMITDHQQSSTDAQAKLLKQIKDAGIPIKEDTHSGLMHDKFTIFHHEMVSTGSFNYTNAASTINDENLIFIVSSKVAEDYSKQFDAMFSDTTKFADWK